MNTYVLPGGLPIKSRAFCFRVWFSLFFVVIMWNPGKDVLPSRARPASGWRSWSGGYTDTRRSSRFHPNARSPDWTTLPPLSWKCRGDNNHSNEWEMLIQYSYHLKKCSHALSWERPRKSTRQMNLFSLQTQRTMGNMWGGLLLDEHGYVFHGV